MRPAGILILLAIVARDGVGPPPDESESPILPLYERAIKTRYCHRLVAAVLRRIFPGKYQLSAGSVNFY